MRSECEIPLLPKGSSSNTIYGERWLSTCCVMSVSYPQLEIILGAEKVSLSIRSFKGIKTEQSKSRR
ncbi:hypothetical protein C5167_017822 [Papaver somniferum]|uniref:Uncharacterized protein n=1 Tax=Papaver somniferum TaxID=3469 RepID=A0A4Y7IPK3_PAPSO|nr:hypothetical protein C5167_017822 [Papaver somniferum]